MAVLVLSEAREETLCYFGITVLIALGLVFFYSYLYLAATQLSFCLHYNFNTAPVVICLFLKMTSKSPGYALPADGCGLKY